MAFTPREGRPQILIEPSTAFSPRAFPGVSRADLRTAPTFGNTWKATRRSPKAHGGASKICVKGAIAGFRGLSLTLNSGRWPPMLAIRSGQNPLSTGSHAYDDRPSP